METMKRLISRLFGKPATPVEAPFNFAKDTFFTRSTYEQRIARRQAREMGRMIRDLERTNGISS